MTIFEEDLFSGERIISEIRVITGARPFSFSRGIYEKLLNLLTCGLRQRLSIGCEHFLWMKSGDSHHQRLALTSHNRILLWSSHIEGTATCACCWSVPVLDHFLVSNTHLQTFDLDDVAYVQQKAVNSSSCWPYQTVRLRLGFKTYTETAQELDPFGYVKTYLTPPSSTSTIQDKFEWVKLFWKISTFIIWVQILKSLIIGFAAIVGVFFPSIRECIYGCIYGSQNSENVEALEFFAGIYVHLDICLRLNRIWGDP